MKSGKLIKKKKQILKKKKLLMFIGDRGTSVGSHVKGFRRFGGKWKEEIHSEAVNVCITNENLTSKTCFFCFDQLVHPQSRDSLSALAIGLVGLSTVLFGIPFPEFLNNKISENYAEDYIKKTSSFKLQKKTGNHEVIQKIRKIKHNIKKRGLIMFN
ncbi:hypothetical protein BDF21DRAFT_399636 [Thamnidium elegans]|nr:hypothetical protein BDF21DRAFT_399636 [Thamnidium elegans]